MDIQLDEDYMLKDYHDSMNLPWHLYKKNRAPINVQIYVYILYSVHLFMCLSLKQYLINFIIIRMKLKLYESSSFAVVQKYVGYSKLFILHINIIVS